jgi:hypothetical protein
LECPKCQSKMELGFVADQAYGGAVLPAWYSGELKRTFWGGLNLRKRTAFYVQTLRCTACGYLESYAR